VEPNPVEREAQRSTGTSSPDAPAMSPIALLAAAMVAPHSDAGKEGAALDLNPYLTPRRHAIGQNRVTLPCGDCGRRIAWWTEELRSGWLGLRDDSHRGWKWQGPRVPVRFRGPVSGPRWDLHSVPELPPDDPRHELSWLVDVECPSCGWRRDAVARQPGIWWLADPELT
jgi:hypothetical protein